MGGRRAVQCKVYIDVDGVAVKVRRIGMVLYKLQL